MMVTFPGQAWARPGYMRALPPGAQRCQVCHFTRSGMEGPNAFGKDWKRYGSLEAVRDLDSDGDGYTNGEELRAGTLPGDPRDYPGAARGMSPLWIGAVVFLLLGCAGFWMKQRRKG